MSDNAVLFTCDDMKYCSLLQVDVANCSMVHTCDFMMTRHDQSVLMLLYPDLHGDEPFFMTLQARHALVEHNTVQLLFGLQHHNVQVIAFQGPVLEMNSICIHQVRIPPVPSPPARLPPPLPAPEACNAAVQ